MKKAISMLSFSLCIAASTYCVAQTNSPTPAGNVAAQSASAPDLLISQEAYALPWKTIAEQDIAWQKRVWRNIDANLAMNSAFAFDGSKPEKNDLTHIMIQGFFEGKYKAYSGADDRFTKELTKEEMKALLAPGKGNFGFNPNAVASFRIKEDWLYVKSKSKIVVRIVGIAPLMDATDENGHITSVPAFWVYYPDARTYFATQATNSDGANWDVLIETRNFGSTIEKTIDVKKEVPEKK